MKKAASASPGTIRVGIGGWVYEPWRSHFYPAELPKTQQLHYASRRVTAIEINSTFYGAPRAATFAKWHQQTPPDFLFSVKAPRSITQRRDLEAGKAAIASFIEQAATGLKEKLGPLLWQFAPTKVFAVAEFESFLAALPQRFGASRLRHALEVRHASFVCDEFVALARRYGAAVVYTDTPGMPAFADTTSDFVYLRLRNAQSQIETGYSAAALQRWAEAARSWSSGAIPKSMKTQLEQVGATTREVFVYFINGAKERAPAAAQQLIELLK